MSTPPTHHTLTTLPTGPPAPEDEDNSPQRTAEAKAAFEASLRSVGANYEADLRDRARNLHANAAALDKQEADLRRATDGLARQNDQLARVADTAREGLKEIGDVQNWAEMIERDLLVIEETVRLAEEREEELLREEEEDKLRRGNHVTPEDQLGDHLGEREGEVNGVVGNGHVVNGVVNGEGGEVNGVVKKTDTKAKAKAEGKKKGWFSWW